MSVPVTAEEKTNKKNDVKARSLLLMALPNEHQITFSYTASFSDNVVYAFMVENPNVSNLLQQDLEQIHKDDLEAMNLKWQLSLLKWGHFTQEIKALRNKEGQFRNQDNTRKHGNNEDPSSKAMLAIDGVGFDWSDMAEEPVKTNMALMVFSDSELDLSYSGLDEFKEPEFKGYGSENSKQESNVVCDQKSDDSKEKYDDSLVKEQVSKDISSFVESSLNVDKETVFLVDKKVEFVKPKNHENPVNKSVRLIANTIKGKGWTVNTAHPKSTVFSAKPMSHFSKIALSTVRRPFQSKTVLSNKRFTHKVNTSKAQAVNNARPKTVNSARPKVVKTASLNSAVVNAVRVNQGKPQQDDIRFVDSGCSRHMTGNIAYLSDFIEFDGDYVTFGGGAHGGRISGKGTLKTDSLDFEDVYFVNELKFNLFSVSHMCDKKNYVLLTNTECLVLSPNFKLPDETHIRLKIPRKDNMYSFDMKNIVPKKSLTCLVAKATLDESML
ncbi:hypothetical protein Tco_0273592 [Tanacetum coccineum]